jgi:hypothetical protein
MTWKQSALAAVFVLASMLPARAADPIDVENWLDVALLIKPCRGEDRWAAIPWQTSLWQARQTAAREGKPIVLWEMDGHPLGCT